MRTERDCVSVAVRKHHQPPHVIPSRRLAFHVTCRCISTGGGGSATQPRSVPTAVAPRGGRGEHPIVRSHRQSDSAHMSTQTLLIIVVLVLLFGGGGFFWSRRGR